MKTAIKPLLFVLLSIPLFAARQPGNMGNPNNSNPAPSTQTPVAPKYVDPVDGYLKLYDTNHSGRLDKDAMKKMSILDPTVYTQAMVFANDRGELEIDQLTAWRNYCDGRG